MKEFEEFEEFEEFKEFEEFEEFKEHRRTKAIGLQEIEVRPFKGELWSPPPRMPPPWTPATPRTP